MSRHYKHLTGIDLIKGFCSDVLAYGIKTGLDLDGLEIRVSPGIAKALEMDKVCNVEYDNCTYEIPIIVDDSIAETTLGNSRYGTDIFIGNPDWEVPDAQYRGGDLA